MNPVTFHKPRPLTPALSPDGGEGRRTPPTAEQGGHAITRIEGHKIRLRDLRGDDLERYRHWNQPGHPWQALDGPYFPRPTAEDVDQTVQALEARIASADWPEPRLRLVIAQRDSDALLGLVSRYWISRETHWAALGIVVYDAARWGRGVGHEALGLWTDHLFAQCPDWVRLDLRTWSGNRGMVRLAEKLGYRLEARFRKARIVDGEHFDGLGFGVLRDEWARKYPDGFAASIA